MATRSSAVQRMIDGYQPIINRFTSGETSADQFEADFLNYFKSDVNQATGHEFDILDGLFADVDEYVADPDLREATGATTAARPLNPHTPAAIAMPVVGELSGPRGLPSITSGNAPSIAVNTNVASRHCNCSPRSCR
jgi:hypothetical protein